MRYRYLFGWAGGLLMLFLAYDVFLAKSLLAVEGYYQYGLFGGLLMAATVLISAAGQHRWAARWPDRRPSAFSLGTAFREIRESLTHPAFLVLIAAGAIRSAEHPSALQSLMRISYAVFCLNKKIKHQFIQIANIL